MKMRIVPHQSASLTASPKGSQPPAGGTGECLLLGEGAPKGRMRETPPQRVSFRFFRINRPPVLCPVKLIGQFYFRHNGELLFIVLARESTGTFFADSPHQKGGKENHPRYHIVRQRPRLSRGAGVATQKNIKAN